jgi:hypothetical protein
MYVMTILASILALASVAAARPIVIFNGGFGSCAIRGSTSELKASAQMDAMISSVQSASSEFPVEIRTCYALGRDTIYVSSSELNLSSEPMSRDDYFQYVRKAGRIAGTNAPVYVWGQSHGGWTAMKLILDVPQLNYRYLMTVDPISIETCGPVDFMEGLFSGGVAGCQGAPEDLQESFSTVAKSVHNWTNWFQTEFSMVHSGHISEAHQNIERIYNADWWVFMGAHRLTETDDRIWSRMEREFVQDLMSLQSH